MNINYFLVFFQMAKILFIIADEDFRDEELFFPLEILKAAGHETVIASTTKGMCKGSKGGYAMSELALKEVKPQDYRAVIYIGGPGSQGYINDMDALRIARAVDINTQLLCAICYAPAILAVAGVLKGKKATSFDGASSYLISNGATYTASKVESDGNIITADGPQSAKDFGNAVRDRL
jgi:protease I